MLNLIALGEWLKYRAKWLLDFDQTCSTYPLQIAADLAKGAAAGLANVEVPKSSARLKAGLEYVLLPT
jgi:hypothetical protein